MSSVRPLTVNILVAFALTVSWATPLLVRLPDAEGRSPVVTEMENHQAQLVDVLSGRQPLTQGPLAFVQNLGQWSGGARFQVWNNAQSSLWLADDAVWITTLEAASETLHQEPDDLSVFPEQTPANRRGVHIRLQFVDANPAVRLEASGRLPTQVNYLIGADEAAWRAQAPVWSTIRYIDLYPGIDLEMGLTVSGWSWQFTQRAPAPDQSIRLMVEGADSATVEGGVLLLSALGQEFSLPLPASNVTYEVDAGEVFEIQPAAVAESFLSADTKRAPDGLVYSSFLGGVFEDVGRASAIDYAGKIVVAGWVESENFPATPGSFDVTHNGVLDAYVARFSADGSILEYATFLGGSGSDGCQSVAVDGMGRVYVAGWTESPNFPVTGSAYDRTFNGMNDAFVLRLNASGSALDYSSYLGGTEWDKSVAVAVDSTYRAYIAGYLFSVDYPTTAGAYDQTHNGSRDGFLTRMNAAGTGLDFSTYLGGLSADWIMAVTADDGGRATLTGYTQSPSFPATAGAYDTTHNGGTDGFVTRFSSSGAALEYSTFFGGSAFDAGFAIAVDSSNRAYVTGETQSTDFPTTAGVFDRTFNGQTDAYVLRLNTVGNSLSYSTYLGGSDIDRGFGVAVDTAGQAYVAGDTLSANFPTSSNAYDRGINGGVDAFLAAVSGAANTLGYSTFIGGSGDDRGFTARVFDFNTVAITGDTVSGDFPVTASAYDPYFNGFTDAFIVKLEFVASPTPTNTPTPTPTPTRTWTPTPTHTWTPTPTRTWTPTPTWTPTSTHTPGATSRQLSLPVFLRNFGAPAPATPTPTPTSTPVPGDPYEPNNSFSQAWGPMVSNQVYRALIYGPGDHDDFYWFDMPLAREIQVDLWDIPAGNDYHLYLYNANRVLVDYSGNPGNLPEQIRTNGVVAAGRYYVRVQQVVGYSSTQQYSLRSVFR